VRWGVALGWWLIPAMVSAYPADVENIPPGQYVPVALREMGRAHASIHLTMYVITFSAARRGGVVSQLLDALADAQQRGVAVHVLLDRSFTWTGERGAAVETQAGSNAAAADYLRARGVEVAFDDEATLTHAKVLILDEATVLLGSTNWSEAALTRNREGTVLVRSPALARELIAQFAGAARAEPPVPEGSAIRVPEAFLTEPHHLGWMIYDGNERAFDLYLALLRRTQEQPDAPMILSYPFLAEAIGLTPGTGWHQRHPVRRGLARLQHYGLITYDAPRGQDPTIRLTALPGEAVVTLPTAYWTWGWDRRLTFGGKVLYLVSRREAAHSPAAPTWFRSQEDLAARYGSARVFIHHGLMDLRRQNLIEVAPDALTPGDYTARTPNRYTPNPLYDPATVPQALAVLEARHGKAVVARAQRSAAVVYEDRNVQAITRLVALEQEFGPAVVRRAVAKVGAMSGNNPKKAIGYLVRTIQGMGGESS